jgi:hypothetical protein
MAAKLNVMKLLQELRGFAEFACRRPQPKLRWLPLLLWRSQFSRASLIRGKRIRIEMQSPVDIPDPVKIVHRTPCSAPEAKASAP